MLGDPAFLRNRWNRWSRLSLGG